MNQVYIHPLSDVQTTNIGEGTRIWQFVVILPDAIIGKGCNINASVFIENDVTIGNNVTVKSGVQLWDGISIEDNVFIGPNVTFTNDLYPRSRVIPNEFVKTKVSHHASIGANSTILAGVKISAYSMIGAGSVVTRNVNKYELVYGNPAVFKGYVCSCGGQLDKEYSCVICNSDFRNNCGNIEPLEP
ncbi:MAG: N-acetyltransferase [Gammaproteobacteria bacterium]|nr:N-acetyltransferase [Gammaproteobacteria bacterium]